MRDGDHPGGSQFSLPLRTACLSFLSHICSPAAHAWGNKEDGLSPWAKSCVSANWSLLLLSQYNSVAQTCPFLYLLCILEVCYELWPTYTYCYSPLSPSQLLNKKWTPSITVVISFLRYASFDSRTITASNKFSFYGKQILRYTWLFVALNFLFSAYCCNPTWLSVYPQKFRLNDLPLICLH